MLLIIFCSHDVFGLHNLLNTFIVIFYKNNHKRLQFSNDVDQQTYLPLNLTYILK
jgi:hypothetical protein